MRMILNAPAMYRGLLLCWSVLTIPGHVFADERPNAPDTIPGAVIVTAEELAELILSRPELVILDSRKNSEFAKGHIEKAINLVNSDMRRETLAAIVPDRNRAIVFYCNGVRCMRSTDAVKKAMEWGYKNVFWFRGGWDEWTEKRLPAITR